MNSNKRTAILNIYCPDQRGIIAIVTDFIHRNGGNVVYLDQYVDRENEMFFMRVEWELDNFVIPHDKISDYFSTLLAAKYRMEYELFFSDKQPRMAIFVSKMSHCFYDLLVRATTEWNIEVPLVISNHPDMENVARQFGCEYFYLPVTAQNKNHQEQRQLELLHHHNIDFVVLARYMQILTSDIIRQYPNRVINIHHSFLPAFPGARPYHQAHERGVKIIGATSHYVTEELDAGPIIVQDVAHISHKESVDDLVRKGKDLEKMVLARAVWRHIQRKVMVFNNKTIVFD